MPFSEVKTPLLAGSLSKTKLNKQTPKVWSRRSVVLPHFVESTFTVHNGKSFIPIKVSEEMVGHKFGEFAITRKKPLHKGNRRKQIGRKK
jgi:small subunit ribosomal protein S19